MPACVPKGRVTSQPVRGHQRQTTLQGYGSGLITSEFHPLKQRFPILVATTQLTLPKDVPDMTPELYFQSPGLSSIPGLGSISCLLSSL